MSIISFFTMNPRWNVPMHFSRRVFANENQIIKLTQSNHHFDGHETLHRNWFELHNYQTLIYKRKATKQAFRMTAPFTFGFRWNRWRFHRNRFAIQLNKNALDSHSHTGSRCSHGCEHAHSFHLLLRLAFILYSREPCITNSASACFLA